VLLSVNDSATVFAATAALLLGSVLLVLRIGISGEPGVEPEESRMETALAGWRTIVSTPALRVVIGLFSMQTIVAGLVQVLVVVLAIELLELGDAGVGWLNGLLGAGATAGAFVVAAVAARRELSRYFALGLALWGLPLLLIAAWPAAVVAFAMLALVGVGNTLVDITGITLIQRAAPDAVLSRVFGAFEALALMAMGAGALLAPLLVSALGTRTAVLIAGCIVPLALVPLWRPLALVDHLEPPPTETFELLRSLPMFSPLGLPELEHLTRAARVLDLGEGAVVFREGDPGDLFYVITDGRADVESDGWTIRELGAGDFFGEIALLRDVPRTATVRALTPLRLLALERGTFLATVTGHAASAEAAGALVAARLRAPMASCR
jgi:MFS family permease